MSRKPNVYISCPISVSLNVLKDTANLISKEGANPVYWNRFDKYNHENDIKSCDAFVLINENNAFKKGTYSLPIGCLKELKVAIVNKRDLYLSYESANGRYLYQISTSDSEIVTGLPGTTGMFTTSMKKKSNEVSPTDDVNKFVEFISGKVSGGDIRSPGIPTLYTIRVTPDLAEVTINKVFDRRIILLLG